MKKALTFLLIFSLMFYPQRESTAQKDSTITKQDVQTLNKKDAAVSAKIDSQLITAKKLVKGIEKKRPEKIVKFRTLIKNRVRTDSFYVYIDTCYGKYNIIQTPTPDTIWMERNKGKLKDFLKNIFNKKKEGRKDEIKVIQ